ncbi:aminotransferase class V-fold PLP-dependent enzyme [Paracoccaceae bacterium Fryx2]|nr:aminotransferase class V-fold PLP-dependent enzyme [Paracoccaceae bacterium Fryx2]
MTWTPLPLAPAFPPAGFAPLADRIAALLGTQGDVLLIQGEAVVALEAAATSLGRPGLRALNIVTSLYGAWFGAWLRRQGAEVTDLRADPGLPVTVAAVDRALDAGRYDLLAVVHAESASGILNPLAGIAALARAHGALVVADAVASVGGHPLEVDALGLDVTVIGPQKSLGGQAGVSAIALSPRAWEAVAPQGEAPSILSLADQRALWLAPGRGALPGTPSALEFHALQATLDRVEAEGLPALIARHEGAARAARAGVKALLGREWVPPAQASNLVTAAPLPEGLSAAQVLAALPPESTIGAGVGPGGDRLLRLNHTGPRARLDTVLGDLAALGAALRHLGVQADVGAALSRAVSA